MRSALAGIGLIGFVFLIAASSSGERPTEAPPGGSARVAIPASSRGRTAELLQLRGRDIPVDRSGADGRFQLVASEDAPDSAMLVMTEEEHYFALKDTNVVVFGNRQFIYGIDVGKTKYTKGMFPGKRVWLPIDEVTMMASLELDELKVD